MSRPLPIPTRVSRPHWEGCVSGNLLVQHCGNCCSYVFPPAEWCPQCFSETLTWEESSGRGTIHSYTTVWRPQSPGFDVPYIVIVVQLEEGWYMTSNLIGTEPEDVSADMPVEVVFVPESAEITLPMFQAVGIPHGRDSL